MDKTIQQIQEISFELIGTINASQKLEKLASMARTEFEDENNIVDLVDLVELVDLADQKVDKKNEEIRENIEKLVDLGRLYLALTTPYDPKPYNPFSVLDEDKEELGRELEALYEQYKELTSIGPEIGRASCRERV